mmetsp:Transcript_12976/g.26499  ORF Transcript_12976/g.26499 Transcript_12976/m.26499 type:complete len:401 (-) Transcript_12976:1523-2725(-)
MGRLLLLHIKICIVLTSSSSAGLVISARHFVGFVRRRAGLLADTDGIPCAISIHVVRPPLALIFIVVSVPPIPVSFTVLSPATLTMVIYPCPVAGVPAALFAVTISITPTMTLSSTASLVILSSSLPLSAFRMMVVCSAIVAAVAIISACSTTLYRLRSISFFGAAIWSLPATLPFLGLLFLRTRGGPSLVFSNVICVSTLGVISRIVAILRAELGGMALLAIGIRASGTRVSTAPTPLALTITLSFPRPLSRVTIISIAMVAASLVAVIPSRRTPPSWTPPSWTPSVERSVAVPSTQGAIAPRRRRAHSTRPHHHPWRKTSPARTPARARASHRARTSPPRPRATAPRTWGSVPSRWRPISPSAAAAAGSPPRRRPAGWTSSITRRWSLPSKWWTTSIV